ncbi:putative Chitinase domain-containing protein [Monocercomonoides exilis]|uniref:putative Chitinase domain-containing protein n=1 Tax=Monocercomonoides exilis TaxID=2049356 RepID=UPI00355974D4|nr:putative Chitinase domain-containing protein [Monocercomonoides exilis]|eukprot:MONOS_11381.1-p1 / transcript=MONOS_11381.1 / gene=MONOS_11381 / organism=Monocercomonoides_exilis_PA203 / gene_product=Chitinase domain-containing protein / transcript_product=Chitinase domain-containing protein / location=Mono_scaffold00568:17901-20021(+) / protein_length=470 / sequence_SO=supercontig / SO=protein_coding / is_pseudo=false
MSTDNYDLSNIFVSARKARVSKLHSPLTLQPRQTTELDISQRGLVESLHLSAKSVLDNCQTIQSFPPKSTNVPLLVFVTPWNKEGYATAVRNKGKIDIIVPVWYNLRFGSNLKLTGEKNVDKNFINQVKADDDPFGRTPPKIVPRIYFEGWTRRDFLEFLGSSSMINQLANMLIEECQKFGFSGIFLDYGSLAYESWDPQQQEEAVMTIIRLKEFYRKLSPPIHLSGFMLYASVAPNSVFGQRLPMMHSMTMQRAMTMQIEGDVSDIRFHQDDEENERLQEKMRKELEEVSFENDEKKKKHGSKKVKGKILEPQLVDGVVISTLNYSQSQSLEPNAPLDWQMANFYSFRYLPAENDIQTIGLGQVRMPHSEETFLCIPFYGFEYVGGKLVGAVTNTRYIDVLRNYKTQFMWDEGSKEHIVKFSDEQGKDHTIMYPSIMSIRRRAEEMAKFGAGIGVWELGTGLDYFMDAL